MRSQVLSFILIFLSGAPAAFGLPNPLNSLPGFESLPVQQSNTIRIFESESTSFLKIDHQIVEIIHRNDGHEGIPYDLRLLSADEWNNKRQELRSFHVRDVKMEADILKDFVELNHLVDAAHSNEPQISPMRFISLDELHAEAEVQHSPIFHIWASSFHFGRELKALASVSAYALGSVVGGFGGGFAGTFLFLHGRSFPQLLPIASVFGGLFVGSLASGYAVDLVNSHIKKTGGKSFFEDPSAVYVASMTASAAGGACASALISLALR